MDEPRIILHVDMDAFFAAVEQRENPELVGKPVIIGADPKEGKGRGVVSTCSYEARAFGVHSAMPIQRAYKLCPHGVYIWPNGKLYSKVSKQVFAIFNQFTNLVEPISIDEAFLDVTGSQKLFGDGVKIAHLIKNKIKNELGLIASVGVAPIKFVAKIASDLDKPDGLVVVKPGQIKTFLHPLPIKRLWGAGIKTQQVLHNLGIQTIGDITRFPESFFREKLGKTGLHFYRLAQGIDPRTIKPHEKVKSISNEHTFASDLADGPKLRQRLNILCEKVGYRLRVAELKGKTIHLKLRYSNFTTLTRNRTITYPTNETNTIINTVVSLFEKNYMPASKVRLIGVGVSGFGKEENPQLDLFNKVDSQKDNEIDKLEDSIRKKFGVKAIKRADSIGAEYRLNIESKDDFKIGREEE